MRHARFPRRTNRDRRLPTRAAAAALAMTAFGLLTGPAAHASVPGAPPCYGSSCVGRDPNISLNGASCVSGYEGSEAAYDVETIGLQGYGSTSVTLRYSPLCGANWARWNGGISLDYWVETKDGRRASAYGNQGPAWTTMVDGTQLARVCIFSGFDDTENCSGWH